MRWFKPTEKCLEEGKEKLCSVALAPSPPCSPLKSFTYRKCNVHCSSHEGFPTARIRSLWFLERLVRTDSLSIKHRFHSLAKSYVYIQPDSIFSTSNANLPFFPIKSCLTIIFDLHCFFGSSDLLHLMWFWRKQINLKTSMFPGNDKCMIFKNNLNQWFVISLSRS